MTIIKLTSIDGGEPIYVATQHIASIGTAYSLASAPIQGLKPQGKKVGTLVNLVNGVNHGVTESVDVVVQLARGIST